MRPAGLLRVLVVSTEGYAGGERQKQHAAHPAGRALAR
ncbi:hypothetical protein K788_0007356 (plasmid) [Paraburkholderia caribensis MBA4]|uniref:Uncharacterized protein n=1 Tax=Paraburkholderia caribensis MBA4 TaxID=1323664 RepID=A0A0P0RRV3_9BURK|nr:hypothetical protein K788_0007356 [Paraburkholderia caribensis MBA4]